MTLYSPLTPFWLLLFGGAILAAAARLRPRLVDPIAAAVSGLSLLIWLLLKPRLPLSAVMLPWSSGSSLPSWNWGLDQVAWQLSFTLLLLLLSLTVVQLSKRLAPAAGSANSLIAAPLSAAQLFWLAASALLIIGADSMVALISGWLLLIILWGWMLFAAARAAGLRSAASWTGVGWLLLSLFLLWLAAAEAPAATRDTLDMAAWPRIALSSVLTAALLQMGVWPFLGWRLRGKPFPPAAAAALSLIPALAGASLLARLLAVSDITFGYTLFLTAFGLIGMTVGLYYAWSDLFKVTRLAASIALVQASIALLTAVWAGSAGLVAETRVMVLAAGILFVTPLEPMSRANWWRAVGPGIALAALAGMPLTVGYSGRAFLYHAWIQDGRFILIIVSATLTALLVAALVLRIIGGPRKEVNPPAAAGPSRPPAEIVYIIGSLLPAIGLFSAGRLAQPVHWGVWIALLLPFIAGLFLIRFSRQLNEARQAAQHAFSLSWSLDPTAVRRWLERARVIVQEAAVILEGEGGTLWLLVLLIIFLIVR